MSGSTDYDASGAVVPDGAGEVGVQAAVSKLDELDNLPVADHAALYELVHADLQRALNTLDED